MKKIIVAIFAIVFVVIAVWAFWVSKDKEASENVSKPPAKIERTVKTYGDVPFESPKLKDDGDFLKMWRIAESDERIFLLSDGKWIEDKILENLEDKYEQTQEGLKYLSESEVDKWHYKPVSYLLHIGAFKRDILQDYPNKKEYIDTLSKAERMMNEATKTTKQLKDDKIKNEIESLIKKAIELREE